MARLLSRLRDFGIAGLPSSLLTWSQRVCEQIEATFSSQQDQITAIAALQATQTAQLAQILAAQAAADAAQTTADTAKKNDAISASWTSPGSILSASDAGSNATITVAGHTRHYGDVSSVSVTGANITALAYSTFYNVYYDDPTRAGGAVTFHATTDPNLALPNAASGRHFCGTVTTPASGGGTTSGGYTPSGGGYTGPGAIP